jgi:hypothetical protein
MPIVATYTNAEDAMTAVIMAGSSGFTVKLRDDDSGLFLDTFYIGLTHDEAIAKAKRLANV